MSFYICREDGCCLECPIYDSDVKHCDCMIEVEQVKHGKWIKKVIRDDNGHPLAWYYECSLCVNGTSGERYCECCGAKMDNGGMDVKTSDEIIVDMGS